MTTRIVLLALVLKYNADWNKVFDAIKVREELTDEEILSAENYEGNYAAYTDDNYPEKLRSRQKAPFVLFYEGDLSALENNNLIFLYGYNDFNLPEENLIRITDDNKVSVGGRLKVWFNCEPRNVDRYFLAVALANKVLLTKAYLTENTFSFFINVSIRSALANGIDLYVKPTNVASYNNQLIKDGAFLADSASDLMEE